MSIENAARAVAEAKQNAVEANTALAEAQDVRDQLQSRVAALQTERAKVVQSARGGADEGKAALRIGIIDADLADLAPLLADADGALGVARAAATTAAQAAVIAEQHLQIAADADLQSKLEVRATDLAALLWAAVGELNSVWRRRTARPTWFPSDELVRELERLRLTGKGIQGVK